MPIVFRPNVADICTSQFRGAVSDAEFDEWLAHCTRELEAARRSGRRCAFITSTDASSSMTSRQRNHSASWTREHTPILREALAGHALVLPGAIQRGVLTAILWMVEYPAPLKVFATEDEAREWARGRLDAGGSAARL